MVIMTIAVLRGALSEAAVGLGKYSERGQSPCSTAGFDCFS